jgi:uncharacterized membrane protein YbhN (UPF0104 family)
MRKLSPAERKTLRLGIYVAVGLLLVWLIIREWSSFRQAWEIMKNADTKWLVLGILALFASIPATALVYKSLSPRPLRFGRTMFVQTAGLSVNKLLPSGSGAIGISFLYLRANKLSNAQSGTVVLLNNLLGMTGHLLLLTVLLALYPDTLDKLTIGHDAAFKSAQLFGLLIVLVIGLLIVLRARLARFTEGLKPIFTHPARIAGAQVASMGITLSYALSLLFAAQAVGVHLDLVTSLIVLTGSVFATAAVPTPGGIGAAEAGAYAGLLALGVSHNLALATAILFRVCTFWIPLLVGSLALAVVAKRGYLRKA